MKDKFICLLGAAVLIIGTALLLNNRLRGENLDKKKTPTSEFPVDTENDGIYINYQYGFKFNYPKDIFVQYNPNIDTESRIEAKFSNENDEFIEALNLTVFASNKKDELEYFEKFNNLQLNEFEYSDSFLGILDENLWPFNNKVKIREIEKESYKGFVLYSKYIGYKRETEPTHGHSVSWLKDYVVITVSLVSPAGPNFSDPLKEERLKILDSIIESFEFFEPALTPN